MASYGWAWVKLPEKIEKKMLDFGKEIPKSELHENGRELEPHITIKYGLNVDDPLVVKECLSGKAGGKAHLGVSSIFENEDFDVVKVSAAGEALHRLHGFLNRLPHEDSYIVYKPHATIAYVKPGFGKKYAGNFLIDEEFDFDIVWFKKQGGTRSLPINLSNHKFSFNLSKYKV